MNIIGEKIAELRKSKGMTQEELANTIGVSSQSISKWENSTTMPDIMLLPVIADIFDVSIDTLYGKENSQDKIPFPEVYDLLKENLLITINKSFYDKLHDNQSFEDHMEEFKKQFKSIPYLQTGILCGKNGAVYYSEPTGGVILPKIPDGWSSLLYDESVIDVLECLKNQYYRAVFNFITENRHALFTASSVAKKYSFPENGIENVINDLVNKNILKCENIDTGDSKINIYKSTIENNARFFLLFVALTYLKRFSEFKPDFYSWCG